LIDKGQKFNYLLKFGFIMLPDSRKMFLPMATIEQLLMNISR